jgi:U5 snRNP spliceosome subunit
VPTPASVAPVLIVTLVEAVIEPDAPNLERATSHGRGSGVAVGGIERECARPREGQVAGAGDSARQRGTEPGVHVGAREVERAVAGGQELVHGVARGRAGAGSGIATRGRRVALVANDHDPRAAVAAEIGKMPPGFAPPPPPEPELAAASPPNWALVSPSTHSPPSPPPA